MKSHFFSAACPTMVGTQRVAAQAAAILYLKKHTIISCTFYGSRAPTDTAADRNIELFLQREETTDDTDETYGVMRWRRRVQLYSTGSSG